MKCFVCKLTRLQNSDLRIILIPVHCTGFDARSMLATTLLLAPLPGLRRLAPPDLSALASLSTREAGAGEVVAALFGSVSSQQAFSRQRRSVTEVESKHAARETELTYGEFDLDFFFELIAPTTRLLACTTRKRRRRLLSLRLSKKIQRGKKARGAALRYKKGDGRGVGQPRSLNQPAFVDLLFFFLGGTRFALNLSAYIMKD